LDKRTQESRNTIAKSFGTITSITKQFAFVVGGASVATGLFIKEAGKMEQSQIAFETMLGSAEKAKDLLQDITDFAAKTPFELNGLINSSKQLIAFGFTQDEIIKKMGNLGDIAAGIGSDKLPTLVRSFGKIRTKGRASMEELNMMLEAGVPILDELSKNMGVTNQELFKMVSAGKVGFKDVSKALESMSTGSGKFSGLMEKQSKSLFGVWSNIKDVFTQISISIGQDLLPEAKRITKAFLDWVEANKDMLKQKVIKYFKVIFTVVRAVYKIAKGLAAIFGGLENAIKGVVLALIAWKSVQFVHAVGMMAKGLKGLIFAFKGVGKAAVFAQIKIAAMGIAIIAGIALLALAIEDIVTFFDDKGGKSVTGLIVEKFKEMSQGINKWLMSITGIDKILSLVDALNLLQKTTSEFLDSGSTKAKIIKHILPIESTGIGLKVLKALIPGGNLLPGGNLIPGFGTKDKPINNVNKSQQNGTVNNKITVNTQASDAGTVAREIQSILDTSYQNVLVSGGGK